MQAAIGCAQLEKLSGFVEARKKNWQILRDGLAEFEARFILPAPPINADPSWFGFLLTIRAGAGFNRDQIVQQLETKGIQTRMLFAGNLINHPCFDEMRQSGSGYRVVGNLAGTDLIMNDTLWVGVYPGMSDTMLGYMLEQFANICRR
jgi:CDP-6-deoxy-D-xylo-4-hexulose-3-dehydrase